MSDDATGPRLDLAAVAETIGELDGEARTAAAEREDRLTKPAGALGRLEEIAAWVCAVQGTCPPNPIRDPRVVVFAGDHGVARVQRTSAYPPEVTAQMVLSFVRGTAAVNVIAREVGARVRVVDMAVDADDAYVAALAPDVLRHKVRRSSGSIDREPALSREEAETAILAGMAVADEEVDSGADLLIPGDMGIGNTTAAAAITGLLANMDPASVVGRGTGIDDQTWMRKCAAVRDAMRRGRDLKADPVGLLAQIGGADIAAMTGFLLQAAARRTPVILDGTVSGAAGLVAHRAAFRSRYWWLAGHRSTEPAHAAALERIGLEPVLEQGLRLGEGTGALLALPLVRAAVDTLREMATFDEAGVAGRLGAHPAHDVADIT